MKITSNFIPYPKQAEILESILHGTERYHVLCASRQVGKSLMATVLLLATAINKPGSYSLLVSPIWAQSAKTFKDLAKAAGNDNPLITSINNSDLMITFANGSVIRMASGESYQNLRGITVSGLLCLDESSYVPEELWTEILRPMVMVHKSPVLFISTPAGTANWFYKIFNYGMDPEYKEWKSYRISAYDNPFLDQEELELTRKTVPDLVFQQEYLGLFVEGGGSVFGDFSQCATLKEIGKINPDVKVFGGLDLAIAQDFTVLTLLDENGDLVEHYRTNGGSWEQIIDDVAGRINKWKAYTLVEKNNVGSVIYETLSKKCPGLVGPFNTTQDSKQDIIEALKLAFAQRKIRIPTDQVLPILHIELASFGYKMLPSGKIKYEGPSGVTDDCVLSLAFALKALETGKKKGVYAFMGKKTFGGY